MADRRHPVRCALREEARALIVIVIIVIIYGVYKWAF